MSIQTLLRMSARVSARWPAHTTLAIAISATALLGSSVVVAHDVALEGDIEIPENSDGYVNVGGEAIRTGDGECVKLGGFSEDNQVNACEGIEEAVVEAEPEPAPAPPPEPVAKEPTVQIATLGAETLFASDSADLGPESEQALATLLVELDGYQEISGIEVVGHTDAQGSDAYNQTLSEQRAQSVRSFLEAAYPDVTITSRGEGESNPVATNTTPEGRQLNRRVEIEVTAKSITDA